jgi:hypothetical protein
VEVRTVYRLETSAGEWQIVLAAPAAGVWEAWLDDEFVGCYASAADAVADLPRRRPGDGGDSLPATLAGWQQI